jgi:hypothetical protein
MIQSIKLSLTRLFARTIAGNHLVWIILFTGFSPLPVVKRKTAILFLYNMAVVTKALKSVICTFRLGG